MKKVAFLILIASLLVQCHDEGQSQHCSTAATVKDLTGLDGCGWVFELQDGTRLEPMRIIRCGTPPVAKEATEDPLDTFEFVDGKKVFINYEVTKAASICMVGPVVKITCITEASIAIFER